MVALTRVVWGASFLLGGHGSGRVAAFAGRGLLNQRPCCVSLSANGFGSKAEGEGQTPKMLPKDSPYGAKFDNPKVGDFQVFDSLVCYPTTFTVKAVGDKEGDLAGDLTEAVAQVLGQKIGDISVSTRETPKYLSVSLKIFVKSADELYKAYEVIDADKRVRFKF
ncbi:unnamed protein product [Chrysoparadoxa australica]